MRRRDGEDGRSMELGGFYVLASTNRMGTKTLQEILVEVKDVNSQS